MKRISMIFTLAVFTPACDEVNQDGKGGGYQGGSELADDFALDEGGGGIHDKGALNSTEELGTALQACAQEGAAGSTTCAKDALAAYATVHEAGFDFTDEIEWVEPERTDGTSPRCFGDVKVHCYGHECCGSGSGCAEFCNSR